MSRIILLSSCKFVIIYTGAKWVDTNNRDASSGAFCTKFHCAICIFVCFGRVRGQKGISQFFIKNQPLISENRSKIGRQEGHGLILKDLKDTACRRVSGPPPARFLTTTHKNHDFMDFRVGRNSGTSFLENSKSMITSCQFSIYQISSCKKKEETNTNTVTSSVPFRST